MKTKVNFNEFMSLAGAKPVGKRECEFKGGRALCVTEKQKSMLHKFGIGFSSMNWRGQASDVIDIAMKRCKKNLATAAQLRALSRKGVSDISKRTFKEASFILAGNDPDSYAGLEFTFLVDGKEEKVYSRKAANIKFQELRAAGKPILVKMIEK